MGHAGGTDPAGFHNDIASNDTASNDTASNDTASNDTASNDTDTVVVANPNPNADPSA